MKSRSSNNLNVLLLLFIIMKFLVVICQCDFFGFTEASTQAAEADISRCSAKKWSTCKGYF